jgi:hypothetical protein
LRKRERWSVAIEGCQNFETEDGGAGDCVDGITKNIKFGKDWVGIRCWRDVNDDTASASRVAVVAHESDRLGVGDRW